MQLLNRPIANNGDPSPTSPGNLARFKSWNSRSLLRCNSVKSIFNREWENHVPGKNPDYCPETEAALKVCGPQLHLLLLFFGPSVRHCLKFLAWQEVGFEAVPVKAGDLICFAGTLDHLSLSNKTEAARHTFQLHLVEGPEAGVTWGKGNWMQYPEGLAFPSLRLNS